MSGRDPPNAASRRPRGFALVPALFLLVVLAALALAGIRIGVGQQQTVTLNLLQARALAAANAGIEWSAYQAIHGSCVAATRLTLTEAALNGFVVQVSCSAMPFSSGGVAHTAYVLSATAASGTYGQPAFVQRTVRATFTDANS